MPVSKVGLTQSEYLEKVASHLGLTTEGLRLSMRVDTTLWYGWMMVPGRISSRVMPDYIHRMLEIMVELVDIKSDRRDEAFSG